MLRLLLCALWAALLLAQPPAEDCPALVDAALAAVSAACDQPEANEACYGHIAVQAFDQEARALAEFAAPGDRVGIAEITTLETAALNPQAQQWGIALLALQANVPETMPGQFVTFVVFGEANLEIAPAEDAPMQAFRFTTGIGESRCQEAPRAGLLLRAPQNITVTFTINGIQVSVSSTVLLRAAATNALEASTLEGRAAITSGDVTEIAEAGFAVSAVEGAPPQPPQAFAVSEEPLPLDLLPVAAVAAGTSALEVIPAAADSVSVSGGAIMDVPANAPDWVRSQVTLASGQTFSVTARGQISVFSNCPEICTEGPVCATLCAAVVTGPSGSVPVGSFLTLDPTWDFPILEAPLGALIGRISDGEPFLVGAVGTFAAQRDGTLQFRVNENSGALGDETGAFSVEIVVYEQ
ncbi:MAG: hypothetical protein HXY40_02755 [Chloroflexi bacterium]|nr:hypothetical protein [Chloroflexota bacterium]